ncbi:Rtr1/RPAP2 family-domain-containing protein [Phyllosticta citriasiana]|uniref:RNA polymerase II subunit B1 CTD phosphatase RPAP2 homolog n=2 Tax=Phyllosticta citriasiana TaxID=595635 RepID=A0ABR1KYE7_9PEZI
MPPPKFDASAALPKSILRKINNAPPAHSVVHSNAHHHAHAYAPPQEPRRPPPRRDPRSSDRNKQIALHHATLIQQQKDVEAQILDAIVQLLDFPSSPDADPKRPSPADASQFKSLIMNFQPSDYDSLLEERKCAGRCSYALCPRPPKVDKNGAKKKFLVRGRNLQIVDREKLELWCSEDCARRALFVKVQLDEEPAWLRRAATSHGLELMVDDVPTQSEARYLNEIMSDLSLNNFGPRDAQALDRAMADLALERGETVESAKSRGLVKDIIMENDSVSTPKAPQDTAHASVEGYEPRLNPSNPQEQDDDGDWILT